MREQLTNECDVNLQPYDNGEVWNRSLVCAQQLGMSLVDPVNSDRSSNNVKDMTNVSMHH